MLLFIFLLNMSHWQGLPKGSSEWCLKCGQIVADPVSTHPGWTPVSARGCAPYLIWSVLCNHISCLSPLSFSEAYSTPCPAPAHCMTFSPYPRSTAGHRSLSLGHTPGSLLFLAPCSEISSYPHHPPRLAPGSMTVGEMGTGLILED